jgi:hypothetical protein
MSDKKIDYYRERLRVLPNCRNDDFYRLADYFELKCFASIDGIYSIKEFIDDALQRTSDLGEGDFEDNKKTTGNSAKFDKWERISEDVIRVVESRLNLFKDSYPFKLTKEKKALELKEINSFRLELYIFLLLSSSLRYTSKFQTELTSSFEIVSLGALKNMLPKDAVCELFGSSNVDGFENDFDSSKLWDKLQWLKTFLNEELRITEDQVSKYDKGDKGMDLVAKLDFKDNLSHFLIYFAQCACSPKDWVSKQHSIKDDSWQPLIALSTKPNEMIFIPQSFRDAKGCWHDEASIHRTNLIDRYRIMARFNDEDLFKSLSSYKIINDLRVTKESVV